MTDATIHTVYLQLKKRVQIKRGKVVTLRDIALILCEPEMEERLYSLVLAQPHEKDGNLLVMDLMWIIPKMKTIIPNAYIESIGNQQVIVEIVQNPKKPSFPLFVLVWILLFFGSALTIMNFHADVNMMEVQVRVVEMITGHPDEHPYLFQVAYSIGIGFGMVVFFNHLFKKKWNDEPTPLEVEMYLYQENIDQYVVAEEYKKAGTILQKQDENP
ncbi:stage V sporulation protein AA [Paenibacillus crassostreae]|uniref:Stage V sporulation protein AA n=1 Tax=Paenibacillus crassostreae TaxID=1763538 RepID=A0A167DIM8_9BACL|nr:stage V sporulation protein AA [Paenibacillus crassostreae]AOZ91422.1 stage V sporulation protein AA [Paenibacillus crassostreae]OAB74419.1 stage V sporulation protein AA [Paenibacillus crassostreae]